MRAAVCAACVADNHQIVIPHTHEIIVLLFQNNFYHKPHTPLGPTFKIKHPQNIKSHDFIGVGVINTCGGGGAYKTALKSYIKNHV